MKRLVALLLAIVLCLSLCACGKSGEVNESSQPDNDTAFVKPENYASVLLVTINPQIKLYLDSDNKVLAVEPVNDDAKQVVQQLDIKNKKIDDAVENIISVSNEKGFVKEDANVKFEITEKKSDTVDENEILSVAKNSAQRAATSLNFSVSFNTGPVFTQSDPTVNITNTDSNPKTNESDKNTNNPFETKFTSVKEKVGKWKIMYTDSGELYDFYLVLHGEKDNWWAKARIGDHFTTLPEDAWADIRTSDEYAKFNDQEYYMAKGDGRPLISIAESDTELHITDSEGQFLALRRKDENTFLIAKSSPDFAGLGRLPLGKTITFVAD